MKKISTAVIGFFFAVMSNTSIAGLITVVGDVNSDELSNQTFYDNVLGSSDNVLFNTNSSFYGIDGIYQNYSTKGLNSLSTTFTSITESVLSNVDLLVFSHRSSWNTPLNYTSAELSAINQFLIDGGDLLLVAESNNSTINHFANFNSFLSGVGSGITYTGERVAAWDNTQASVSNLTVGQATLHQGYYDILTGGNTIYSLNGKTSVASEIITASVPEPSTLAIFALGMIGLASRRFKKQS
jgi:hypothetical protein